MRASQAAASGPARLAELVAARSSTQRLMPELEDEQRPQLLAVVPAAGEVLRNEPVDLRGVEEALRRQPRGRQLVLQSARADRS